jgi:6-phosphogluconolactonase
MMRTRLGSIATLVLTGVTLALTALTAASPQTPPTVGGAGGPGQLVFIGTYTSPASQGIYAARLNPSTGELSTPVLAAATRNPSFVAASHDGRFLYAVNEVDAVDGKPGGGVSAFAIDAKAGTLKFINQQSTVGGGPCHVSVVGSWVFVANYGGGSIVACPVKADGSLEPASSFVQHKGSGANPQRQAGPHAHGVVPDPTGRFLYVPDLGLDQVKLYKIDAQAPLTPGDPPFTATAPGSGPRHITLSKDGRFAYVITEIACTIQSFARVPETGALTPLQTISTLPDGQAVEKGFSTAEVLVHPSGRFLVGSNRGHNSLVVYSIDKAGKLTLVQHIPTGGETPRAFNFDPTGGFVVVGNQNSDLITVFRMDAGTGKLTNTGHTAKVGKPVSFEFVR